MWLFIAIVILALGYLFAYALCKAAALGDMMVCGHSKDDIVSTDEGTHYCSMCEYEARQK